MGIPRYCVWENIARGAGGVKSVCPLDATGALLWLANHESETLSEGD